MIVRLCFVARPARTWMSSSRSDVRIRIASRSWSAVALSRMSLLVAPRWTYLPASPSHASVRARTTAMRSCLVSSSSAWTRLTVTCFVVAFAAISAPAGSGINPTFASARARAASTSRSRWRRASSSKIAFIFGRPYRKSIGQSRDMATREGKARTRYGAFLSGTRLLLFRLLRFEDFDVPDLSQEHRLRFAGQAELHRRFVQPVPHLVHELAERNELALLAALHHARHVVPAEAQDRAERTAVRPSRRRVLLQQSFVLLRPRLEVLVPAFLDVPELNPEHNRPSWNTDGRGRHYDFVLRGPGVAGSLGRGSRIVNVDPVPGWVATAIDPWCASTTAFARTRPRPTPSPRGFVVKNGWKSRVRTSSSMPAPVSVTPTENESGVVSSRIVTEPLAAAWNAVFRMFTRACWSRSGSTFAMTGSLGSSLTSETFPWRKTIAWSAAASTTPRTSFSIMRTSSERLIATSSATRISSSRRCSWIFSSFSRVCGSSTVRSRLEVSSAMFVNGVRTSCATNPATWAIEARRSDSTSRCWYPFSAVTSPPITRTHGATPSPRLTRDRTCMKRCAPSCPCTNVSKGSATGSSCMSARR